MDRRVFLDYVRSIGTGAVLTAGYMSSLTASELPRDGLRVGVIGVGGAGRNLMQDIKNAIPNVVRTIAINTDTDALRKHEADQQILIATAKGKPPRTDFARRIEVRRNAITQLDGIAESLAGLDLIFVVAGMGGVAGTEIAPIAAKAIQSKGIPTIGVSILPFDWEGDQTRGRSAREGSLELGRYASSLIHVSNQSMQEFMGQDVTLDEVFALVSQTVVGRCRSAIDSTA